MIDALSGSVLAGGRSSRFGSDKAFAPWGGGTLASSAVGVLCSVFTRVMIVGKNPAVAVGQPVGVRFVPDGGVDFHPLSGIVAALDAAETERIFVTACDMPDLNPGLIRALAAASSGYAAAAAVWNGRPQPLFAVYSRGCAGVMRLLLREGRPIREIFESVPTRFFREEEIGAIDPAGESFRDLDTREEYEAALGRGG